MTFRSKGIVTYRDDFAYATTREGIAARIQRWLRERPEQAAVEFRETRDRKAGPAFIVRFDPAVTIIISKMPISFIVCRDQTFLRGSPARERGGRARSRGRARGNLVWYAARFVSSGGSRSGHWSLAGAFVAALRSLTFQAPFSRARRLAGAVAAWAPVQRGLARSR
jgi:hypothetical protein